MSLPTPSRLRQLRPNEIILAVSSPLLFPALAFALRRWGLQRVQRALTTGARWPRLKPQDSQGVVDRLVWVIDVAGRRGLFQPNCLQRSLLLWWALRRRGIQADLRIGVRRRPGSASSSRELDFHAWVECNGIVVNDVDHIRDLFATFERAIAPANASWRRRGFKP